MIAEEQKAPPMPSSRLRMPPSRILFAAAVAGIIFLSLWVRLLYWQDARAYALRGDEPDYVLPAQTLLREGKYVDMFIVPGRTWTRVPLTSLFFAASFLFVPDSAAAGAVGDNAALMQPRYDALNLAQIGLSLLTVLLIMALAARAFPAKPRKAALIAGLIAALYPPLASSPAQNALSESTAIALVFASIYGFSWWRPAYRPRTLLLVAASSGALLGAASLARPVAFTFLPFLWVWFVAAWRGAEPSPRGLSLRAWLRRFRTPLLSALLATATCFLAISPWTLYNYRHYGRFLLLDTASATAFWNYHNYRGEDITARMWALPNPADRLSLIVQEGTANILEYPNKALDGTLFALGYFWHLESNSAVAQNPWDMTQRDPDVPDLLHADAVFVFVGLAGMAGLAGVGLRRPTTDARRALLLLSMWLLASVLLGLVVPYDARYRLPAAPSIVIMAAGLLALADWGKVVTLRALPDLKTYRWPALGAGLLCLWVVVGAYSPNIPPLLRSEYQAWRGDMALAGGDASGAVGRYVLAQQAFPKFYWPYRHAADASRKLGKDDEARVLYSKALGMDPDDPYAMLGLADLASAHPEWRLSGPERGALARDEGDWRGNPWNSFTPRPTGKIDVGMGTESPYLLGFYKTEQSPDGLTYRWSRGRATLRLPLPVGKTYSSLVLHMAAPALGPARPMNVQVTVGPGAVTTLQVPPSWADYTLPLPSIAGGSTLFVTLTSPVLSPADLVQGSKDTRELGVGLDSVEVK